MGVDPLGVGPGVSRGLTPLRHCDTLVPVRFRLLLAMAALSLTTGCEWIGGIEAITLTKASADAGTEDAESDAAPSCDLPREGDAFLRLGVLVPSSASYDFCIKPAASPSFDDVRPLLASGGEGCPDGLLFKDLTIAFRVESGTYDVRMVAGDAQDCSKPIAEIKSVDAVGNQVTTVLAFSDSSDAIFLRDLPESKPAFNRTQVRFVHALVGQDEVDCGATNSNRLPASILTAIFRNVAFGAAAPAGSSDVGKIDDNGYFLYSTAGGTLSFGIAEPGSTDALATLTPRFALNSSHSLFAVGRSGDASAPPALWSCDEGATTDGILATCGDPLDVAVEIYSTQLTDLFTPLYRARIGPVLDAVAHASSDVLCVNEARSPEVLQAILEATKEAYPHREVSLGSIPSDSYLADRNGSVPEPYTTGACAGDSEALLSNLMDCIEANCTQDDGTGHRFIDDGNAGAGCVSTKCVASVLPLFGTDESKACWMCTLTQMAGEETTEWIRQACVEDPQTRYAYRGSLGIAVLSKYPMGEASSFLLPSTGWQRGLLRVPIDLPNGAALDVYCGDLTLPVSGPVFPYVGHYGGEAEDDARWVAEQLLQAERVVQIINDHTPSGMRVVLASTTYAGPAFTQDAKQILEEQSPEVFELLSKSFAALVPPGYVPSCTQCINNPVLNEFDSEDYPVADAWTTHLLGRGFPPNTVKNTSVTFTEASYEVTVADGVREIPPSSQYGLRSVLRITQ